MEKLSNNLIAENFEIRNRLVSIFEQMFFLVNTLNQNKKPEPNKKTEEINIALKTSLNDLVFQLWEISAEYDYYWHNCPSKVYVKYIHLNKDYLLKTYGKRRYFRFLEKELNSFLTLKKTNDAKGSIVILNDIFQDAFILLDYVQYLSSENSFTIQLFNKSKIEFLKSEIEKDGYEVLTYQDLFKVQKIAHRKSSEGSSEIHNAATYNVQNININIDDKAFSAPILKELLSNFNSIAEQNRKFNEYPDPTLDKKGLPKLNVQTRFYIAEKIGLIDAIKNVKSSTEQGRTLVLGSLMDINADNARHLYKKTYRHAFTNKDEDKLNDFLDKEGVTL